MPANARKTIPLVEDDAVIAMSDKLAEGALRNNSETLSMILNTVPQSIFWKDDTGHYLGCNRVFATTVGLDDPAKIVGLTDYDLPWPREEADAYRADDRQVIESKLPKMHIIEPLEKKDGTRLWIDTSKVPLCDSDGRPYGILGVYDDISERKLAQEAVIDHSRFLEAIIQTTVDGFWIVDGDARISRVNEAYCRMSGYSKEELNAFGIRDVDAGEDPAETAARMRRVKENGNELFETKHRRKDGSVFDVEISTSYLDVDGGLYVCFCRDISERKKVELALRESEERLKFVLQGSELGYWDWNLETGAVNRNERWAGMLGYDKSEVEGKVATWTELQHPDDRARTWAKIQDHLEGRTDSYSLAYRMRTKDGGYKWVHDCGKIMARDAQGRPLRLCGTHADIDEQMRADGKIRELLAEKELILKEVHHRIKNNMNVMRSLLNLQAMHIKDAFAKSALEDAGKRMKSMESLYDQLYRSADFTNLSVRAFLGALVDDVVGTFPNCRTVRVEKTLDDFLLDIKRLQPLGIIVNELLTNSMKYAFAGREAGRIMVSATLAEGRVTVTVRDDGIGLKDAALFDDSKGFGFQLVHALAAQLQGSIRLGGGEGTTIVLEFGN